MTKDIKNDNIQQSIFRFQFVLNFLVKKDMKERLKFLTGEMKIEKFEVFIYEKLIPLLEGRINNIDEKKRIKVYIIFAGWTGYTLEDAFLRL